MPSAYSTLPTIRLLLLGQDLEAANGTTRRHCSLKQLELTTLVVSCLMREYTTPTHANTSNSSFHSLMSHSNRHVQHALRTRWRALPLTLTSASRIRYT